MSPGSLPSLMRPAHLLSSGLPHPQVNLHTEKPFKNQVRSSCGAPSALPGLGDGTVSNEGSSPAFKELPLGSTVLTPSSSLLPTPSIPKPNTQDFFPDYYCYKKVYANYGKVENTDKQK